MLRVGGRADEAVEEEEGGEVGVISIKGSRSIAKVEMRESVTEYYEELLRLMKLARR